jgi:ribosomal protein S18 acetylase RimI-like enzyme
MVEDISIEVLTEREAQEVAELHIKGINTGFISSLGIDFVTVLYEAIANSKDNFGLIARQNNRVLGFVAFTANLDKLYKSIILKKGWRFVLLLAGKMFCLKRIKKVLETLFYPRRIRKMNLPDAEILSIVIAPESRKKGLAIRLIKKGLAECTKRKIKKIKVLVGAGNEPANKLYLTCGFELVGQIDSHGVLSNIYVAQTDLLYTT